MSHEDAIATLERRFPGRRAVITGGASGLGYAVAELLGPRGWKLLLIDRDADRLAWSADTLRSRGSDVSVAALDVTDHKSLENAVAGFAVPRGGLDLALNAAGIAAAGPFMEVPPEVWDRIVRINLLGVVDSCRAEIPYLRQAGGGLIINVASAAGFASGGDMSAYNATKAAVISLSETLMQELRDDRIQVTVAMPGFFRTRLLEGAHAPPSHLAAARRLMERSRLEAPAVASEIVARAARGATHIVLPRLYRLLWLFKRIAPRTFIRFLGATRKRVVRRSTQG